MPIQNAGVVPKYRASRKAGSAVTDVSSRASRSIRVRGTRKRGPLRMVIVERERGTPPAEFRPDEPEPVSSPSCEPSVIIHDLHFSRTVLSPEKHDSPLIVDADRMHAGATGLADFTLNAAPAKTRRRPVYKSDPPPPACGRGWEFPGREHPEYAAPIRAGSRRRCPWSLRRSAPARGSPGPLPRSYADASRGCRRQAPGGRNGCVRRTAGRCAALDRSRHRVTALP